MVRAMKKKLIQERIIKLSDPVPTVSGKRLELPFELQGCRDCKKGKIECKFCVFAISKYVDSEWHSANFNIGSCEYYGKKFDLPRGVWADDFSKIDEVSEELYQKMLPVIVSFYDTNLIDVYMRESELSLKTYWKDNG